MCRGEHAATASAKSPAAGQELMSKKGRNVWAVGELVG